MLDHATIEAFKTRLRGKVLQPDDAGYEAARTVYNALIDRRPRLIARCVNVADVIAAVKFAGTQHLLVAVRGGGHHGAGLGTCDDGLVIDLSRMKGIRVDPIARTVQVEGGCTWGDVDHATHAFGLATPGGIMSTTGVGGLTLGGGLGHLTRTYGLAIDNLLAVDMVLADGRYVTASAEEYDELFWAIRGGGGNFGIVTSFLFQLHPLRMVYAGPMLWPLERATAAMQCYRDVITQAPDHLNGFFAFLRVPPGPPFPAHLQHQTMCGVIWCYTGPLAKAEAILRPIRAFGPPALDLVGPLPYPALQSMCDALYPPGLQWYWRADFVHDLSADAIAQHVQYGAQIPTRHSMMHLYPINGAAHRVGPQDTAFSYREATWAQVIVGGEPDPANTARIRAWTTAYWEALHPYVSGGAYVNFLMEEGQERIRATYRDNYQRLVVIKNKYDPTNLFRMNQNIMPTV
jgi:FAD/FMN-containing dehydrogenase